VLHSASGILAELHDTTKENPMSSPARFTAAQKQAMRHTLFVASNDLNFSLQTVVHQLICFDVPKEKIISSVGTAAQRSLYLEMTDAAADFGQHIPEYENAAGTVARRMVDREAKRCAERLYADTLVP
jgi:hypothetical protein